MDSNHSQLQVDLQKAQLTFQKACEQIVFFNKHLDDLQIRYDRANREGNKSFRYSLRLKIAAGEGLRNTYYEYACFKADLVASLRRRLSHVDAQYDSDSSMDIDEDAHWTKDIQLENNPHGSFQSHPIHPESLLSIYKH